jgi:DNA-binding NarL/FixJ family response regulator
MAPRSRAILTPAQWRVLERLARGESNEAIARALRIGPGTVRYHLTAIDRRLPLDGAADKRVAAVAWYQRTRQEQQDGRRADTRIAADAPAPGGAMGGAIGPGLTALEWRLLALVAEGHNDAAIARALLLSRLAVAHRLRVIYARLPLGNVAEQRAAAADWYAREGGRFHAGDA